MKVGDYVRTKYGIGKIIETRIFLEEVEIRVDSNIGKITNVSNNTHWNNREDIIKSSPNIIDLIEVGDYVNGMEVTGIGGTRWDKNDLHCYCEHNGNENWKQVMIPAKDIKSIVTHEQFESMKYRIEGK